MGYFGSVDDGLSSSGRRRSLFFSSTRWRHLCSNNNVHVGETKRTDDSEKHHLDTSKLTAFLFDDDEEDDAPSMVVAGGDLRVLLPFSCWGRCLASLGCLGCTVLELLLCLAALVLNMVYLVALVLVWLSDWLVVVLLLEISSCVGCGPRISSHCENI